MKYTKLGNSDLKVSRKWYGAIFKGKYKWNDECFLCENNASVNVSLGVCANGIASWNAYPCDDREDKDCGKAANGICGFA